MHVSIVTTSPVIAEVLADELCEVREVTAQVVDIAVVESSGFVVNDHDVVIVTEAAIDRWCRWRTRPFSPLTAIEVIGALGPRWLSHDSPESRGFVGCIDLKAPTRDLIRQLQAVRREASTTSETTEPCSPTTNRDATCHDDIDRRIVAYIAMGMSDRDIGAKVFLSSQTVRNRVSRMLDRSQVANRTQLAMACLVNPEIMRIQRSEDVSTPRAESMAR